MSSFSDSRFSTASSSTRRTSLSRLSSGSQHPTAVEKQGLGRTAPWAPPKQEVSAAIDLNKSHRPLPPLPRSLSDSPVATPGSKPQSCTREAKHERWCTTREHKNPIASYRGFAKHENEHDNYYVFLPHGPIEKTPWGQQQCALCEETNPSKAHLQHHNILKYAGRLGEPDTRSRRGNFEELLKKHKTSNEKIKELLQKWRKVGQKKAYSCGFCITTFRKLSDRTSHIDREHYAKGKHIDDWNDTFVIKGLLLQQDVKEECLKYFHPVDPTVMETEISWPPSVIDNLQLRLELREETPQALAVDVFRQASSRGLLPPKDTGVPDLRSPSDMTERIQMSPSAQVPMTFEKVSAPEPFQSPTREQSSLERQEIQHQAYSNDQNLAGISLTSVSSPSSNAQLLGTSSGFPDWINNPTANTIGTPGFMYSTADNAYEAPSISPTSRTVPDNPLFHQSDHVGVNESNGLADPNLKWSVVDFNVVQPPPFDVSASEAASRRAAQAGMYHDHISQLVLEPLSMGQLPKRKLSDKSAQEANLKAPTQAPLSKFSQHRSTHTSRPG